MGQNPRPDQQTQQHPPYMTGAGARLSRLGAYRYTTRCRKTVLSAREPQAPTTVRPGLFVLTECQIGHYRGLLSHQGEKWGNRTGQNLQHPSCARVCRGEGVPRPFSGHARASACVLISRQVTQIPAPFSIVVCPPSATGMMWSAWLARPWHPGPWVWHRQPHRLRTASRHALSSGVTVPLTRQPVAWSGQYRRVVFVWHP